VTSRVTGLSDQQVDQLIQRLLKVIVVSREPQCAQSFGKQNLIDLDMVDALAQFPPSPATSLPFRTGSQMLPVSRGSCHTGMTRG
jgi:hypothetical protein